jgi:hypothetical protein
VPPGWPSMCRGAALASVLALAGSLAACGSSPRDRVNGYIEQANAIRARAAPEFARANSAYKRFSANKLAKNVAADLERAEASLRDTRAQLARLHPPAEAKHLQSLLLRLFDLDIGLAHETTLMGEYLPAATVATKPLKDINARLQKGLTSQNVSTQTDTLGTYRAELRTVVLALQRLDPPPLLSGIHSDQLSRLDSTMTLAAQLRRALKAADQQRISDLLIRFRTLNSLTRTGITDQSLRAYEERQQDVSRASQAVEHEQNRLAATLR